MKELFRKLEKDFVEIYPLTSIQKAYEILADPNISTLFYFSPDKINFYYITDREIKQSIQKKKEVKIITVKDIAIESLVFNYDQYIEENAEYITKFKRSLSGLEGLLPEKFLIFSNDKPLGLVSDIELSDLPSLEIDEEKSELDKFIESESDPVKSIDKFFSTLTKMGFKVTPEVETYVKEMLEKRLEEILKIETGVEPPLEDMLEEKNDIGPDNIVSKKLATASSTASIVVTYSPNHVNHHPSVSSPEMPERLINIMELLKNREKIFNSKCRLLSDYSPASEEDILRVHTQRYIKFVKDYAAKGGGFLGDSTYITKITHELALLAIGGAIKAAEVVLARKAEFGFALIRPPGHHASKNKYGGYCIYNNAAVLARYLQQKKGLDKILILDWDAHAANGTMDIFYDDPTVMLISLHQDPHNYYPKTGYISQLGKADGIGYTINMEMPRGSGDEEYETVFSELVMPLYKKFQPDFIIGCNGFDSHHSDQFTDLQLTSRGYYDFCSLFREHMKNKMVLLMEGGYNPYMGNLTHTVINSLLGLPNPFEDKHQSLVQKVLSSEKIHVVLNQKLKELKMNLRRNRVL